MNASDPVALEKLFAETREGAATDTALINPCMRELLANRASRARRGETSFHQITRRNWRKHPNPNHRQAEFAKALSAKLSQGMIRHGR